jgi:hypothetical protein
MMMEDGQTGVNQARRETCPVLFRTRFDAVARAAALTGESAR